MDPQTLNEDWIKVSAWDLPTDATAFMHTIGASQLDRAGQITALSEFSQLPAWQAVPVELIKSLTVYFKPTTTLRHISRRYSEDQPRDSDGRFAGGDSGSGLPTFPGSVLEPVDFLANGKQGYKDDNPDLNMPGNFDIDYSKIMADPVSGKAIADLYDKAPTYDPDAQAAYDQMIKETAQQYEYLTKTLGVTVESVPKDPYKNVQEMVTDVRDNHHLSTLSTATTGGKAILPTGKPILTNEQNDQFRAVHDAFGHASTGRAFDRNGEASAWTSHMQMYSPLAGRAVTTETHARNSVLIYGRPDQKTGPAFAAQKVFLLPEEYSKTFESRSANMDTAQLSADDDNLYDLTHSHHTSQGRYLVSPMTMRHLSHRYSEDQPRDEDGRFASGGADTKSSPDDISSHPMTEWGPGHKEIGPGNDQSTDRNVAVGSAKLDSVMSKALKDQQGEEKFNNSGMPMNVAFKEMVATNIAAAMTAKDGDKWDKMLAGSPYVSMAGINPTPRYVIDSLTADNYVQTTDSGGALIVPLDKETGPYADMLRQGDGVVRNPATGDVTRARADTPEALQMVREAGVAGLINQWAHTSNDSSPESLAMQESAVKEFGLKDTAEWKLNSNTPLAFEANLKDELAKNGELYQAFLRAQYDTTQSMLKSAGIESVGLFRGQVSVTPEETKFASDNPKGSGHIPITTAERPLSSWSTRASIAEDFANGWGDQGPESAGIMYAATVPVERILSTPATGFGCYGENEVVVLGGAADTVDATTVRDPEGKPEYDLTSEGVKIWPEDDE